MWVHWAIRAGYAVSAGYFGCAIQMPINAWKPHYWVGVIALLFSVVHEIFIHHNVPSIKDLEEQIDNKQVELDESNNVVVDLTGRLRDTERTIKNMVKEFDSFFDEYLREVIRVIAGNDAHTRVTLYTYNASSQTFSIQNRYSPSHSYKAKSPREYAVTGFLKKIWDQEGKFFKCSKNARAWHIANGISGAEFDTLKLKGKLYSGVRIDIGLQEHAILLLESESNVCWTQQKFDEFFSMEGMSRLTSMIAAQKAHFSRPDLSREIE